MIERVEGLNELPLLHTLLIAGGNYAYEERLDGRIQGPAWHGGGNHSMRVSPSAGRESAAGRGRRA
eukprot:838860-Prorocentrum_minimum.AAC.1